MDTPITCKTDSTVIKKVYLESRILFVYLSIRRQYFQRNMKMQNLHSDFSIPINQMNGNLNGRSYSRTN